MEKHKTDEMKVGIVMLVSDKVDFKAKVLLKVKDYYL